MKKILVIILFALLTYSVRANQNPTVEIANLTIKENARQVMISFDAFIPELGSDYKLILTPVLYNESESQNLNLTPIVVIGKKRSISDKRRKEEVQSGVKGKEGQKIPYQVTIPFESWMNEVSLRIIPAIEGCCSEKTLPHLNLVTRKLIHYDLKPIFDPASIQPLPTALEQYSQISPFLYAAKEYARRYEIFEKQREKGALVIYFEQGHSVIDPAFKNNKNTLMQVSEVLGLIEADPNATLKKIVIVGLASPEGTLARNDILAGKRAQALKDFAGKQAAYSSDLFEIINGSEDWEGLRKLVEESQMSDRQQVLDIIKHYSIRGGRELELMKLNRGNPYRYMMQHFFPQLRNAGYVQIYYDTKPDPEVAHIHNAIALLNEGKYDQALSLLTKAKDQKRVANAIGVCYMMTGNYLKAEEYFDRAIADGNQEAVENLKRIKIAQSITIN